eukprot:2026490-Pleurochrysis_carterae.AAC.6
MITSCRTGGNGTTGGGDDIGGDAIGGEDTDIDDAAGVDATAAAKTRTLARVLLTLILLKSLRGLLLYLCPERAPIARVHDARQRVRVRLSE